MSSTATGSNTIGSALIGMGLAAALTLSATAHAESAAITIGQLEAQGFNVKIDRVGSARRSSRQGPERRPRGKCRNLAHCLHGKAARPMAARHETMMSPAAVSSGCCRPAAFFCPAGPPSRVRAAEGETGMSETARVEVTRRTMLKTGATAALLASGEPVSKKVTVPSAWTVPVTSIATSTHGSAQAT